MATINGILKRGKSIEMHPAAIYTLSDLFSKAASFLLLFYFAYALSETDFGLLSLFSSSILFLMPFISMGLQQSVSIEYCKKDKTAFSHFFSTTLLIPMIVTLLLMILFFIFRKPVQQLFHFSTTVVLLIPLITFFIFLNKHLTNMVRSSNDPVKYMFINIGRLLAETTLVVFLIGAMEWGWMGRIAGIFISYLMLAVYAVFYFKEQGFILNHFSKKYLKDALLSSVPVIAMQAGMLCTGLSAGFFIAYFTHDFAEAGIFSMATALGSVIIMLCMGMLQFTYPKVYSLLAEKKINYAAVRWHFLFYAGVMLLGTGVVVIAIPIAYTVMLKQSYHAGLSYYIFICLGYFFWSISYFLNTFLLYNKEKRKLLLLSFFALVISVVSHTVLIKKWGAYGAAVSICTVYFTVLIITIFFLRKQLTQVLSRKLYNAAI